MKRFRRPLVVVLVVAAVAIIATKASRAYWARPLAGTDERKLVVGGVTRTYLLHAGGDAKPGRPLVLVLHGLGGNGAGLERRTRGTFDKLADQFGAVIVYPQASGDRPRWGAWRVGAPGAPPPPDDLGFLSALIDTRRRRAGDRSQARVRRRVLQRRQHGLPPRLRAPRAGRGDRARLGRHVPRRRPRVPARPARVDHRDARHGRSDRASRRFDSRRRRRVGHARRLSGDAGHVPRCPTPIRAMAPRPASTSSRRARPEPRWRSTRSTAVGTPGPARTAPRSPSATPATRPATSTRAP